MAGRNEGSGGGGEGGRGLASCTDKEKDLVTKKVKAADVQDMGR